VASVTASKSAPRNANGERGTANPGAGKSAPKNGAATKASATAGDRPRPNTPALTRKVLLRDGLRCANPFCRRELGLHAHHIQLRSENGESALWNEVAVCPVCHAVYHAGLLTVKGDPLEGLRWIPQADRLPIDLSEDLKILASLGIESEDGNGDVDGAGGRSWRAVLARRDSARAECEPLPDEPPYVPASEDRGLLKCLTGTLGFSESEAVYWLDRAEAELVRELGRQPTDSELVAAAMKGRRESRRRRRSAGR
jgi:hypothetical protein